MTRNRSTCRIWRPVSIAGAWLLLATGGFSFALADSVVVPSARDATLIEDPLGGLANGSGPAVFAGRINSSRGSIRRALLYFDLASALPPGSAVLAVRLKLNLSATGSGAATVWIDRVLADWGEGGSSSTGGAGAPSVEGDSTWIHRFYPDRPWTQAGGDFDPTPRGSAVVDQPGPSVFESTAELVADVQTWLDDPARNFGWILIGDESRPQTVKRFDSRESSDGTTRPVLEIDYAPPCIPDPAGPGYWRRQCADAGDGIGEPVLECASRTLAALGLAGIDACAELLRDAPPSCDDRAATRLAVLVLNVCADRLQTSCPLATEDAACLSSTVGDRLGEVALLIRTGRCRRAASCAAGFD